MKFFNITTIALVLVSALTLFTSCSKDQEFEKEVAETGWIGEWSVTDGSAVVYQDGYLVADVNIVTFGSIAFENDGTGLANFGIQIGAEKDELKGPFTWEDEAFEIVISYPDDSVERWSKVDDENSMKRIQFTQKDEENNSETELLLTLVKN